MVTTKMDTKTGSHKHLGSSKKPEAGSGEHGAELVTPMAAHTEGSVQNNRHENQEPREHIFTKLNLGLLALAVLIIIINQVLIISIAGAPGGLTLNSAHSGLSLMGGKDLGSVDLPSLKSTAHTVAAVFPVGDFQGQDDVMAQMFPSGTPEYGEPLGVSFDDPVTSLSTLASMYRGLQAEVQKSNPEAWERFLNLASKPVGISCEYCCGVGPIGIDKNGNSRCGCQHNPALLSVALYLTAYTDYSEGEILREVMRWKTLFFPKNMIELGMSLAGGDTSALQELPGMVGGC